MVGIHEGYSTWTYWDEYIQYLIEKNKTIQKIRDKQRKERSYKLKKYVKEKDPKKGRDHIEQRDI